MTPIINTCIGKETIVTVSTSTIDLRAKTHATSRFEIQFVNLLKPQNDYFQLNSKSQNRYKGSSIQLPPI